MTTSTVTFKGREPGDILAMAEWYGFRVGEKIDGHCEKPLYYPYVFTNQPDRDCTFKLHLLFHCLFREKAVPSGCFECWKIVTEPKSYAELRKLREFQRAYGHPSKCGVEGDREQTTRLYAGYFYCDSKAEGLRVLGDVRRSLPEMKSILKRGCTEYEMAMGPSDRWEIKPWQMEIEEKADRLFVRSDSFRQTPEDIKPILENWIRSAHKWGDMTYTKWVQRLYPTVVTYEGD